MMYLVPIVCGLLVLRGVLEPEWAVVSLFGYLLSIIFRDVSKGRKG